MVKKRRSKRSNTADTAVAEDEADEDVFDIVPKNKQKSSSVLVTFSANGLENKHLQAVAAYKGVRRAELIRQCVKHGLSKLGYPFGSDVPEPEPDEDVEE